MKAHRTNDAKVLIFCPGCECAHGYDSRWQFNGDLNRPTFTPSYVVRSSNDQGDTVCHSFVTDGRIQFLGDCTHALAGQTVDLPDMDDDAPPVAAPNEGE